MLTYNNLTYCHISNGVIDALYCGPFPENGEGFEEVPDMVSPNHGDLRAFWDAEWNLIPIEILVTSKVIPCPGGFKLVKGALVEMTLKEKIDTNAIAVPEGQVFDPSMESGAGGIRGMTTSEQARAGKLILEVAQSLFCAQVDGYHPTLLDRGFQFKGVQYSGKDSLQQRAQGVLTSILVGLPVVFPFQWPAADDTTSSIASLDDFKLFAGLMMSFVQTTDKGIGDIKTAIRAATNPTKAADLFDAWEAKL